MLSGKFTVQAVPEISVSRSKRERERTPSRNKPDDEEGEILPLGKPGCEEVFKERRGMSRSLAVARSTRRSRYRWAINSIERIEFVIRVNS